MSEKEKEELRNKIVTGLREGHRKMLRDKAARGLDVVIADEYGMPLVVDAKELLEEEERMSS